jgi:hypothetical protein
MHHPMPDRFDLAERPGQPIKYLVQRIGMVANFQGSRRTLAVLPGHFDPCDAPDAFDEALDQRGLNPQNTARLFSHVHEPKFDRRASAVDHENMHVTATD